MTEQNKRLIELMKQVGITDPKLLQERVKKAYYEGEPLITDAEYDELFPQDYVGYTPEQSGPWEVLDHKIEMGSLDKLKTWEQAQEWLKDKGKVVWEPKLDGLSMELVYENGNLTHAILRGGGDKGEDILKNAIKFINVLPSIQTAMSYVSVRGEVVISKSNFTKLTQVSNESYSNRRNCVPGICRRYDGKYSEFLSFYAYDIYEESESVTRVYESELDKLMTIHGYGLKLPFAVGEMDEENYMSFGDVRDTAEEFQMDGLVIKTLDMQHQIALKFKPNGERTTVTGYSWEVGSTGKYVPKILFETVNVGGSNLSQAAIGSYQAYIDLGATVGSIVEVSKMGDVIPKVTRVITQNTNQSLEVPMSCPKCGTVFERKGSDLYCTNENCPSKIVNKCCAPYWSIAIKGITSGWIEKLIEQKKISQPADTIRVTAEDIVSTGGFSLERATKAVDEMHKRWKEIIENNLLENLLWMIPIPTISNAAYKKIEGEFTGIDAFLTYLEKEEISKEHWVSVLGNAKGTKLFDYLTNNKEQIVELIKAIKEI